MFGKADDQTNAVSSFEEILQVKDGFEKLAFQRVFSDEIVEAANMKNASVWATGKPPKPLDYQTITKEGAVHARTSNEGIRDQHVWTLFENVLKFSTSAVALKKRKETEGKDLSFDKDDEDALDFVTSATNLRATNYHIVNKSRFDIKGLFTHV